MHSSHRGYVIGCEYVWSQFGSCYYLGLNLACVCFCEIMLLDTLPSNAVWMERMDCLVLDAIVWQLVKSSNVSFQHCNLWTRSAHFQVGSSSRDLISCLSLPY